MALTPEQRLARRLVVGSSDAPAILGVDPHRSSLEVYLSKVHEIEEEEAGEPMRLGNRFEAAILEEAAEKLGVAIERNVHVNGPEPFLAANLDAIVVEPGKGAIFATSSSGESVVIEGARPAQAMEAKYTGLSHLFGPPGSDDVPDKVLVQTAHQMLCLQSLELVHVPVLLARFGRPKVEIFQAPRNQELVEIVYDECTRFWRQHVEPRIPPPPTPGLGEAALRVLKRIRREPASIVQVDSELALTYLEAAQKRDQAKARAAEAQAALVTALGDAEGGDFGDPGKIFTYYQQGRDDVPVKELRRLHPRIAKKLVKRTTFPVLRLVNRPKE